MYKNPMADLMVAFATLAPNADDDESRARIARSLGVEWKPALPQALETDEAAVDTTITVSTTIQPPTSVQEIDSRQDSHVESADSRELPFRIKSSVPVARKAPDWLGQVELFPKQEAMPTETVPVEPLFRPDWTRGILSGALSGMRPDGPIDVPEIITRICHGEAITALPRVRWATLSRGVQLLIDRGEGMTPFRDDQRWLENRLRLMLGSEALEILSFSSCPTRKAGSGSRLTWEPYRELRPPRPGTTVVALTDLGIPEVRLRERQASPDEWIEFARHLRTLGCPLVALVPYPETRWPERVRRHLTVLPWDRKTSASTIRGLVGEGLR